MTTTVYESAALRAPSGGTVALGLLLTNSDASSNIRIERRERLPHKTLESVVLSIRHPNVGLEPLARAMTTITHELERLHRQGYTLRERAGGGWRGAWLAELVAPEGSRAVVSWEIHLKKPAKTLEPLARALAALDVPAPQFDRPSEDPGTLIAAMRERGDEVRRTHGIDALVASDPAMPAEEFLEELDARGLLTPTDPDPDEGR